MKITQVMAVVVHTGCKRSHLCSVISSACLESQNPILDSLRYVAAVAFAELIEAYSLQHFAELLSCFSVAYLDGAL